MIEKIIANYHNENAGVRTNLYRLLNAGKLRGSGKLIILPVDQGFEHGPDHSFQINSPAYDPAYHVELAIKAGLSAYAAPLGALAIAADQYPGQIPLILKVNSAMSLGASLHDQAVTSSVKDALELGCIGIGLTLYPGSARNLEMQEEAREFIKEAKSCGLLAVVWCYPRGGDLTKEDETALDVISYAAHVGCLLGGHIIKVKMPAARVKNNNLKYSQLDDPASRVQVVKRACFAGKRLVVFSGGENKSEEAVYEDAKAIFKGKGDGSIIGRNTFQRPIAEALTLLERVSKIYLG